MMTTNQAKASTSRKQKIYTINPTKMNPHDNFILFHFLEENVKREQKHFSSKIPHWFSFHCEGSVVDKKLIEFGIISQNELCDLFIKLTHTLIWRRCSSDPSGYRYDVYNGKILGSGGFAQVEEIIGTLVPQFDDRYHYKAYPADEARVGKRIVVEQERNMILNEYKFTARFAEFRVKPPTFFSPDDETESCLVMRRFPGQDLRDFFNCDQQNKSHNNVIKTSFRINLAIKYLRALQKVHGNNVIHRDIKPENVLVYSLFDYIKITILDFGLSRDANEDDGRCGMGSLPYLAPEFFNNVYTKETDIYNSAIVLAMIFRADDNESYQSDPRLRALLKIKASFNNVKFINLFIGINDLDKKHKEMIEKILYQMVSVAQEDRPSLDDVLCEFEKIQLERNLDQLSNDELRLDFAYAKVSGKMLRDKEASIAAPMQFAKFFPELQETFNKALAVIMLDNPTILKEFIDQSEVQVLRCLVSKEKILEKIDGILNSFERHLQLLLSLQSDATDTLNTLKKKKSISRVSIGSNLHELTIKISRILTTNHAVTLDSICALTTKIKNYQLKLQICTTQTKEAVTALEKADKDASFSGVYKLVSGFFCADVSSAPPQIKNVDLPQKRDYLS